MSPVISVLFNVYFFLNKNIVSGNVLRQNSNTSNVTTELKFYYDNRAVPSAVLFIFLEGLCNCQCNLGQKFSSVSFKRYEKRLKMQLYSLCRKMYGVSVA
jgi:hypothetical protein